MRGREKRLTVHRVRRESRPRNDELGGADLGRGSEGSRRERDVEVGSSITDRSGHSNGFRSGRVVVGGVELRKEKRKERGRKMSVEFDTPF